MDDANGSLKPRPGSAGAGVNGSLSKSPLNGYAVHKSTRTKPKGPGFFARSFSIIARLLTWYILLTLLFRCPASPADLTETSPPLCAPYFHLRSLLAPHIEPYYTTYAAPHIAAIQPYYEQIDRTVLTPAWTLAKRHGAPRLQQAQAFGQEQWDRHVGPQVMKVRKVAQREYEDRLKPHVEGVVTRVAPYVELAKGNALDTYHEVVVPLYQTVQPHIVQGYKVAAQFTRGTVVPGFVWGWNRTWVFLEGTVWPHVRAVYVGSVEPQLVKIGKRLGRYSSGNNVNGKKSVPARPASEMSSSASKTVSAFLKPSSSVALTSSTTTIPTSSTSGETTSSEKPRPSRVRSIEHIPPPEVDEKLESTDPVRRTAREIVAADLKDWQERYTKAIDEGAAEIEERVKEITKRMIRRNARVMGVSLLKDLKTTTEKELTALRPAILEIIRGVKESGAAPDSAQDPVIQVIRRAGTAIKTKAQDVRVWRENYESEMQAAITKAAETHFAILEHIRDLALQKIGMKWAWMDGVTYKDWAKYHLLKTRFDEWKADLEKMIVTHPSLEAAQIEGAGVEDEAMEIAAAAAKELASVKAAALWKLERGDVSGEWDVEVLVRREEEEERARAEAEAAARAAEEAAKAQEAETAEVKQGTSEAEKPLDLEERLIESDEAVATEPVPQATTPEVQPEAESAPEPESSEAPEPEPEPEVAEMASSAIFETPVIAANTSDVNEPIAQEPSELPVEDQTSEQTSFEEEQETQQERDESDHPSSFEPYATKLTRVPFGAAAQHVPPTRQKIILDDESSDSSDSDSDDEREHSKMKKNNNQPEDIEALLSSLRASLTKSYSSALSRASAQYDQAMSMISSLKAQDSRTKGYEADAVLASITKAYSAAMEAASAKMEEVLKLVPEDATKLEEVVSRVGEMAGKVSILPIKEEKEEL